MDVAFSSAISLAFFLVSAELNAKGLVHIGGRARYDDGAAARVALFDGQAVLLREVGNGFEVGFRRSILGGKVLPRNGFAKLRLWHGRRACASSHEDRNQHLLFWIRRTHKLCAR